jgi:hypothetical protein
MEKISHHSADNRDLIRQRDWDYSALAYGVPPEKREALRNEIIGYYNFCSVLDDITTLPKTYIFSINHKLVIFGFVVRYRHLPEASIMID